MKVSFDKNQPVAETQTVPTPVPGVTIDCPTTAVPGASVEERPANSSTALAPRPESPHAIFDDAAIGFEDIVLPRINIVKRVGDLSLVFQPLEIVLDQTHVLYSPAKAGQPAATPLNMAVIGFKRTSFVEKVDGGAMGLVCRTREEVVKCGGTLDYKEWQESVKANKADASVNILRRFDYMTTALVLIEKPATFPDLNKTVFPYEADGKQFVLAFFTMKASDYNAGAKTIFTFKKTRSFANPKAAFSDNYFTLATEMKKFPSGNSSPVPDISPSAPVGPELASLIETIKGA